MTLSTTIRELTSDPKEQVKLLSVAMDMLQIWVPEKARIEYIVRKVKEEKEGEDDRP